MTSQIVSMSRPIALKSTASTSRSSFIGAPIARRVQVVRAAKKFDTRASASTDVDVDAIVKDLQEKWDKVENKTGVIVYASAAVVALWLSNTVIGALNNVPLLPKLFELVGLSYSAWFTYRYLLFKSSREELVKDIEVLKKKVAGDQ